MTFNYRDEVMEDGNVTVIGGWKKYLAPRYDGNWKLGKKKS